MYTMTQVKHRIAYKCK